MSGLQKGDLVAVECEGNESIPAIARILSIQESDIEVAWLKGTYASAWKPWKLRQGRQMVDWVDTIPQTSIIIYGFTLTNTGRLRQSTKKHLKQHYDSM